MNFILVHQNFSEYRKSSVGKKKGSDVDFKGKEASISSLNEGVYGEDSQKENQSTIKSKDQVNTHRTDKI